MFYQPLSMEIDYFFAPVLLKFLFQLKSFNILPDVRSTANRNEPEERNKQKEKKNFFFRTFNFIFLFRIIFVSSRQQFAAAELENNIATRLSDSAECHIQLNVFYDDAHSEKILKFTEWINKGALKHNKIVIS